MGINLKREDLGDLLKEARKADRQDKERSALFEPLIRSEAWETYVGLLNSRLQALSEQLLSPAGSVDGMVAQEFLKGAMFGLALARDLPAITVAAMKIQAAQTGDESDEAA